MYKFKNNAIIRALVKIIYNNIIIIIQLKSAEIVIFTSASYMLFLNLNIIMQNYTYTITPK